MIEKSVSTSFTMDDAEVQAYATFYATPKSLRPEGIKTLEEFCKHWEISVDTAKCFRNVKGFFKEVRRISKDLLEQMDINVDRSLYERTQRHKNTKVKTDVASGKIETVEEVVEPDVNAIKLFKELNSGYAQKMEMKITGVELKKILAEAQKGDE